jgi:hypothetical protein|tara:strand:- start:1040 stop:1825 length:786 start_codon:yes stop_codon:yes gene_type:complete
MKTKQDLINGVSALPKFELKPIYTFNENVGLDTGNRFVEDTKLQAVTEVNRNSIYATITKFYKLVQFEEVFNPILNHFEDLTGELKYYNGSSLLIVFPSGERFKTNDNQQIGLIVANSVNKSLAINVNFCVLHNNMKVMLPKLNSFRQLHIGNVKDVVRDYESFIGDIQESWRVINQKFDREITETDVESILEQAELGLKATKKLKKLYEVVEGTNLKLWDLFMDMVKVVSDRTYKKEESRINKLKKVSDVLYNFSLVEAI